MGDVPQHEFTAEEERAMRQGNHGLPGGPREQGMYEPKADGGSRYIGMRPQGGTSDQARMNDSFRALRGQYQDRYGDLKP